MDSAMQAIVLAAGEGRRLRPLTRHRPKAMIGVGGRPILEHHVEALVACGITDITLVVGYQRESIQNHFGDGVDWGADIRYAEQKRQLGTGHALLVGMEAARPDEPFLVLPGDNHISGGLLEGLIETPGEAALAITRTTTPRQYGVVHIEGEKVRSIEEKPKDPTTRFISTGIYRLPPSFKEQLESTESTALPDVVNHAIDAGLQMNAFLTEDSWQDAIYPWDLLSLNDRALSTLKTDTSKAQIDDGAILQGPCSIGAGTRVRAGSYIIGPVVIGEGCDIGPNAVLYGPLTICDHTHVGAFTELTDSLILDDVRVDTGAIVRHSIVDSGARLGPRVSMDRGPAVYETDHELKRVDRLGAVIGQDAFIGANVVLEPAAFIGSGASVAPNRVVRRVADERMVV
jgi:UDP-N-acetylglucosamine diphosphorylase / glucose-1-phosphate thymidylyltransferase / UDP-N-acetylgalactosamine diphosphorylase / glucosamine-1-phosphate N-acetyltransferase / galactosamine-1-phosphate N-acetyltransferase